MGVFLQTENIVLFQIKFYFYLT